MIDIYFPLIKALLFGLPLLFLAGWLIYKGIKCDNHVANVIVPLLGICVLLATGVLIVHGAKKSTERVEECKTIRLNHKEQYGEEGGVRICYFDSLFCTQSPTDSNVFSVQDPHISWKSSCKNCGGTLRNHFTEKLTVEEWKIKQEKYDRKSRDLVEYPPY